MTSATAADYAWIRTPSLFAFARDVGYAVTLVRGVTPDEVLSRAGAEARRVCAGGDELTAAYWDFAEEGGLYDSCLVGAFTLPGEGGDWTLVLELGGHSAMTPRLWAELSSRTPVRRSVGARTAVFLPGAGSPGSPKGSKPRSARSALRASGVAPVLCHGPSKLVRSSPSSYQWKKSRGLPPFPVCATARVPAGRAARRRSAGLRKSRMGGRSRHPRAVG
jgi:hypothetical protein